MNIHANAINMKKTYTVTDILFNEVSRKKGTIEYYLTDEMGNDRKVTAMAHLGFGKKIKKIKALYQREIPLVAALETKEINQTFTLDFTQANKEQRLNSKTSKRFAEKAYTQNFSSVIPDSSRFPLLFGIAMLGTVVVFLLGAF